MRAVAWCWGGASADPTAGSTSAARQQMIKADLALSSKTHSDGPAPVLFWSGAHVRRPSFRKPRVISRCGTGPCQSRRRSPAPPVFSACGPSCADCAKAAPEFRPHRAYECPQSGDCRSWGKRRPQGWTACAWTGSWPIWGTLCIKLPSRLLERLPLAPLLIQRIDPGATRLPHPGGHLARLRKADVLA